MLTVLRRALRTIAAALLIALLFAPAGAGIAPARAAPGRAGTLTVTNINDGGDGSLRKAILDAASGDTITFQAGLTGTIKLSSGRMVIDKPLTIAGPGADVLAIDGDNLSSIFLITQTNATISGLTLRGGKSGAAGGAILVESGGLTLTGSTLSSNSADQGGAIAAEETFAPFEVVVIGSTLFNNLGINGGGGINARGTSGGSRLSLSNSTISSNDSQAGGGAAGSAWTALRPSR
jgi:predicted outer membrane repeat protein